MTEEDGPRRVTRYSVRPPSRFVGKGADFRLWIQRVELYFREADVPRDKRGQELASLLDDEPFRIVSQMGLLRVDSGIDYAAVKECLEKQFAPSGLQLEWQRKFHTGRQEQDESLIAFSARLRMLVDKAYPSWPAEERLELVRNQFIHGILSSSIQLKLLQQNLDTLDAAVELACRLESVESAQSSFQTAKVAAGVTETRDGSEEGAQPGSGYQDLVAQVQSLSHQLDTLRRGKQTGPRSFRGPCWECGKPGHVRRNCPQRRRDQTTRDRGDRSVHFTSAVACTLTLQGAVEGHPTVMLVDTGSSVTILHENIWKKAVKGKELKQATCQVMAVNGESLPLCGQAEVTLQVGSYSGVHKVLVVRDMTQQCLLGTDFLEQGHCVINMGTRTLTMAGVKQQVPLLGGVRGIACHVAVQETTVIPPFHQVRLPVRLETDSDVFKDGRGLFEPKPVFSDDHSGLLVAHSVSYVSSQGDTVIQLMNVTSTPISVYAGEKVGVLSELQEEISANAVKASGNGQPVAARNAIDKSIGVLLSDTEGLTTGERENLRSLLQTLGDVISVGDGDLGRTSVLRHKIDTGSALPIRQQSRRLPFHQRGVVKDMIDGMLKQGIIEPSEGAWASPIVLARKKDGSFRFCVDFRRVNDVTKKDVHPLPRIDDALDSLAGAKWFSTLDLACGYWQVEMDPADKEKTSFTTPFGLHQFRVMPFGLSNAPGTFQRLMSLVLSGLCWSTCLVYLDDIIIFSQTVDEHLQRLRDVLQRLKDAGLKIKPSKCQLLRKSVLYLGHIVSEKGVEVDPKKTSCVRSWQVPNDRECLRKFLGFASYYRKFIPSFAQIASPLHSLTEKAKPWQWSQQCNEAFDQLKEKLLSPPILSFPQFDKVFVVDTDASQHGLGAVLSQEGDHVIAYASRVLTKAERQYCATRKEMLGMVWAVRCFRLYLWGRRFIVRTDHNSLQWLRNFKEPQGQVARWLDILAEYDFSVQHRPGLQHSNADALSRLPCKQCGLQTSTPPPGLPDAVKKGGSGDGAALLQEGSVCFLSVEDPKQLQDKDADLRQVILWLQHDDFPPVLPKDGSKCVQTLWSQKDHLVLDGGVLYRRWEDVPGKGFNPHLQLVIPRTSIQAVLKEFHDTPTGGHLGLRKTLEKVRSRFYWPGQRHDVVNWCKACAECASRKSPTRRRRAPMQSGLVGTPMQRVAMDILGPLPVTARENKYVLVVGDYFTKWVEAYPMPNMEAKTVAELFVNHFIARFGVPDVLHTDQGRNFESTLLKETCLLLGVQKTRTSPYHPQSDGLIERFNRTLLNMLSIAAVENERDWDLRVPLLMLAYRTSTQESTGCTPFYLMFGREARLPADVMFGLPPNFPPQQVNQYALDLRARLEGAYRLVRDHMGIQHLRQKTLYDRSSHGDPYKAGDLVWLHCPAVPRGKSPKLHCYWQGPYSVVKTLGDALFLIQHKDSPRKRTVVHFDRLKPCTVRSSEENVAPASNEKTRVPAGPRSVLNTNGELEGDRPHEEPEPLLVEVEIEGPRQAAEPHPVVIEPGRARPVRDRRKPDHYGHNIYDT